MSGEVPDGGETTMDKIGLDKAKVIANKKGLKPGKVKGLTTLQFTKGTSPKVEVISWDEFEKGLAAKKLAVYESNGWMKIMKA